MIALRELPQAERYIDDRRHLVVLDGITALTPDDGISEIELAAINDLVEEDAERYRKCRHAMTWKERYDYLQMDWPEDIIPDIAEARMVYPEAAIIGASYSARSI